MSDAGVKVLVAYATRYGSTKGVADAVGEVLRDSGAQVDVLPVRDVAGLDGYEAVVLGTPFFIGSMLKDMAKFIDEYRAALEGMPVAMFALGPVRAEDDMAEARAQLDTALSKIEWLRPVTAEMFVGAYDPKRLKFPDKFVAVLPASPYYGMGAVDGRDWDAIRGWAGGLAPLLGVVA